MKTNGTYQRWIGALAGLLILALSGCADPFLPKEKESAGETIPPGMGLARISLGLGGERTAVPNIGGYYFTLKFTAPGQSDVDETLAPGTSSVTVALAPATWTLEVKGYTENTHTTLKVSGNISVPITAGTASSFSVYLTPNLDAGGLGRLEYTIDLNALPTTGIRAWLGLYPLEAAGTAANPVISHEYDISTSAGTAAAPVALPDLPQGTYRAVIDLYNSAANTAAVRTEVVHIYDDLTTPLSRSFNGTDFAACPPVVGQGAATLALKLDAALASVEAETCTIVLDGTETDLGAFAPRTINITGNKNRTIIIRGNGATVQVNTIGTPLFALGAASGSSLALELRDITLRGRAGNSVPVVRVDSRGTLAMKTGSLITGNTSSYEGGGVYVSSNGTLSMSGGAVSDNTSSYGGGGVYVFGTFDLSGGAVSGNTTTSNGGGVHVNNGTLSMSGGAVSGNTSSYGGGGVYVNNGTLSMSGGAVSGNTSSSSSSGGGGVYVYAGTLSMSGGTVRDNVLSGTGYGREVLVEGTFKLSGAAMPQRVFLRNTSRYIAISGPLSGEVIPIDLGITSSVPLSGYESAQLLRLDGAYSGNLAELKEHFSLGDAKRTDSPTAGTPISGYTINDGGYFVTE